jgi:PilZ domain
VPVGMERSHVLTGKLQARTAWPVLRFVEIIRQFVARKFIPKGPRAPSERPRVWWVMGLMSERRNARRYDLSLPIMIRAAAQGMAETQKGKTRDISTRGLYFVIDQDLRDGSELDIMLTLPREMTNGDEVLVKASGKVVRVEERLEDGSLRRGVAAIIERYDIMRGSASA